MLLHVRSGHQLALLDQLRLRFLAFSLSLPIFSELFKFSKRIYYKIVFFYNLSIFFDFLYWIFVDVLENLNEREFKIDKEKAILLLPINWIGINYDNEKKYDQKQRDDAKLEIDIINKDIISVIIDGTIQMRHQCIRISTPDFFPLDGKMAITDGYWLFIKPNSFTTGKHTVSSFGSCRSGKIQVNIKYHLTVK
jgi:hypothetical protein